MNDKSLEKQITICLECHGDIAIENDVQTGEVLTCPECSTDFEVIEVNPVKLAPAPIAQEDWGQ